MACTRGSPLTPTVAPVCDGLLCPVVTIVGVSDDHVPATYEKALRRAPWLMTGVHDELVNTKETGRRARQRRVH